MGRDTYNYRQLRAINGHRALLMYDLEGLAGATKIPFAASEVVRRLDLARDHLRTLDIDGANLELLIWDACRSSQAQQALFDRYVSELIAEQDETPEQAEARAREYISDPQTVFPHGTGGAVDLTLLINGVQADMGTGFDAFVPEAARDFYRMYPPTNAREMLAAHNREILRDAMELAGFVGLDSEWWHFEWGTSRWAIEHGIDPILTSIQVVPQVFDSAMPSRCFPARQPTFQSGVAQVFTEPGSRAAALMQSVRGHYYARSSHPTTEGLVDFICTQLVESQSCQVTGSGLSSCTTVMRSLVPPGGCILYDKYVYYEVEREILMLAAERSWTVVSADFEDIESLRANAGQLLKHGAIDVMLCDNPRNWWLDCLDIRALCDVAAATGARLVVDTSVQPLQNILQYGVDMVTWSLSKYASLGLALGGAIQANDEELSDRIRMTIAREGNILSPDSAMAIWCHSLSLRDRLAAISGKARSIAEGLAKNLAISEVRIPQSELLNGMCGGQLAVHVVDPIIGSVAERIIGHNAARTKSGLHLACTFGGAMTTFEHFASNARLREGLPWSASNESRLPADIIRIGIGYEPIDAIVGDLEFVFAEAFDYLTTLG